MNGVAGLNYTSLPIVLKLLSIPNNQHQQVFADIRVMEHAALIIINEKDK